MKITLAVILTVLSFTNTAEAQQYLGQLSKNPYAADSVSNPYNKYSVDSPNNPYGKGWKIIGNDY